MPRFRKKTPVIVAYQWFKNGDHPDDELKLIDDPKTAGIVFCSEGKVVRYYRHPGIDGESVCEHCDKTMHTHGWIDTLKDGVTVCPGDWIITGSKGEHYVHSPKMFEEMYERVD